jgi:hypothetical protein
MRMDLNKLPEAERSINWKAFASRLTPLLLKYETLNLTRLHEVADDSEEMRIDGFVEYALTADPKLRSGKGNAG